MTLETFRLVFPVILLLAQAVGCGPGIEPPDSVVFLEGAWNGDSVVVLDSRTWSLPGAVSACDLDLDDDLDIAAVGPDMVFWLERENKGLCFCRHTIDCEGCANGLLVLDMDLDGLPDLVSAGGGGADNRTMPGLLFWWKNPGVRADEWERFVLDPVPGNFLHDIVASDLDNDGVPEIIAPRGAAYIESTDRENDWLAVYKLENQGTRAIWRRVPITGPDGFVRPVDFGLCAADIDGDGFNDIVQYRTVWLNPKGKLDEAWTGFSWTTNFSPSNIVATDMDGDKDADLVFSEGHSHRVGSSRIGIWFNRTGPGAEIRGRAKVLGTVEQDPENLGVADLDGNDVLDVVTGAMNWRKTPGSVDNPSWNDRDGTLVIFAGKTDRNGGRVWAECRVRSDLAALHHLTLVDMDGDGDLDVLGETAGARPPPEPVVPTLQIVLNKNNGNNDNDIN